MPEDLLIADTGKAQAPDAGLWAPFVPGQLAREAVQVVEALFSLSLKSAETELSELLQSPVKITYGDAAMLRFSDVLRDRGSTDRAVALDLSPIPEIGFLSFELPLLYRALDTLLGAPADITEDPERSITTIDQHILREFFDAFSRSLANVWQPAGSVAFRYLPMLESELDQRATQAGNDPALVLSATIELGDRIAGCRLVIPPWLARLAEMQASEQAGSGPDPIPSAGILKSLGDAVLDVEAVLSGGRLRIRDLLDLSPGRILTVGSCGSNSFDCMVNGRRQFAGELVPNNGRYGIQIAEDTAFERSRSQ